jgi:hypothetical protein
MALVRFFKALLRLYSVTQVKKVCASAGPRSVMMINPQVYWQLLVYKAFSY